MTRTSSLSLLVASLGTTGCALVGGIDADELTLGGEGGSSTTTGTTTQTSTAMTATSGPGGSTSEGGGPSSTSAGGEGGGDGGAGGTGTGGVGGEGGGGGAVGTGGGGGAPDPTCVDGDRNGQETDFDCGGPTCDPCEDGQGCALAADCESLVCDGDTTCAPPRCDDDVQNGNEDLAIDCGGSCACATGQPCEGAADCASNVCVGGVCRAPSCNDDEQNGSESDVDCGGSCPDRCPIGGACGEAADCLEGVCTGDICQAPTCSDDVSNGAETGEDCGGATACARCPEGEGCQGGRDCASAVCDAGLCLPPGCGDGETNGGETDEDCGGPCGATCTQGESCLDGGDCVEGVCDGSLCAAPTCSDGVTNADETGNDCGGVCGATCAPGDPCGDSGDCTSGVCEAGLCAIPACDDAVQNGDESDQDCGGDDCAGCDNGGSCGSGLDCVSGACNGQGACAPWSGRSTGNSHEFGRPHCAAWSAAGELVTLGHSASASLDFGGGAASAAGDYDGFWVRWDRTGTPGPVRRIGTSSREILGAVAAAADGRIALVGWYSGQPTLGGVTLPAATGFDALVFVVDEDDQVVWARGLGAAGDDKAHAVAFASNGDVLVGGERGGTDSGFQWFGDAFVERLAAADGATAWTHTFAGGSQGDLVRGLAVDAADDVIAVGSYGDAVAGGLDLGGGVTLGASVSRDAFVVKLAGGDGAAAWAQRASGALQADLNAVAVLPGGDVAVGGTSRGTTSLAGGAAVLGPGEYDAFLGRLDGNGGHVWSFARGGVGEEEILDLAIDAEGAIWATGRAGGVYTLGGPSFAGEGGNDPWIARLDANNGAHLASRGYGGSGDAQACGVALSADGSVGLAGHSSSLLDLGDGAKTDPAGGYGFFAASLGPNP